MDLASLGGLLLLVPIVRRMERVQDCDFNVMDPHNVRNGVISIHSTRLGSCGFGFIVSFIPDISIFQLV